MRAADRLRAAAARRAAREADRARRMSEAAVKRRDLENFDPDTPLEKLRRAREEMQRNLQQPVNARAMRVCTSCSERWDTAEDGGGDYRWVVYHVSREHSTAAVGFRFGLPHNHTLLFGCIINSSITSKHVHCCCIKTNTSYVSYTKMKT